MRVLAIDTTTRAMGVALLERDRLVARSESSGDRSHSSRLLGILAGLLEQARVRLGEVDVVAVAVGPGSFSGIRVGIATARGLGFALDRPVVGIPSLVAFAWSEAAPVVVVLEARKDEVYVARFAPGVTRHEARALAIEDAFRHVVRPGDRVVGDGAWRHGDRLLALQPAAILVGPGGSAAEAVARLAAASLARGEPAASATPIYLSRSPRGSLERELVCRA
jgi:tRNA threonylcarbamoyladenosine biosynthesis protein TsaB